MYAPHFGLTAEPFSLTPDPDFLYLSSAHAEALAAMKVGLLGKRGLMVMTGEVGTGKTTLLYALLRALGDDMRTAYVSNTAMGFDGILHLALADFGVTPSSHARVDMLTALNDMLRDCAERGVTATLIVDEAQHLDGEAFEQLRLLSNFETFTHKLLQIVLVGQPELEARLRQPALRALAERVAVHCRLTPLGERESRAYLEHRLGRAGGSTRLFERGARDLLLAAAEGLPRRINILCHNALLFAYGRGDARVTRPVAQLAVAGRAALLQGDPPAETPRVIVAAAARRVPRAALAVSAAVLLTALGVAGLSARTRVFGPRHTDEEELASAPALEASAAASLPSSIASFRGSPPLPQGEGQGEGIQHPGLVESSADSNAPLPFQVSPLPQGEGQGEGIQHPGVPESSADSVNDLPQQNPGDRADDTTLGFRTVRVEPGSTLASLARDVYGGVDAALIKRIQAANPRVVDPNLIMTGDLLRFPEAAPEQPVAEKDESR